jgi:hypothetical protein
MFEQRVRRDRWMRGASATLLLVVTSAGCAGWERDRHPHRNAAVTAGVACHVCPDGRTSPPLDWLGGYHSTRWHSAEPAMMLPTTVGESLPRPVLVPQEEVPIPDPPGREPGWDGNEGDSDLPDITPGNRSSTNPTRDGWLTQAAWPAAIPSEARGLVRLPTVVEQGRNIKAVWHLSDVAIDPASYDDTNGRPNWWRHGPVVARPINHEQVTGPLRR